MRWSNLVRIFNRVLAGLGLMALAAVAAAQEDPFGAAPKPGADAAAAAKPPVAAESAKPEPLAIQLLRASNPATPRDLIQAAKSALQFGRPDETKRYLAKLLAEKPADEDLTALTAPFADFLLQLDRTPDLQPEGKQAAEMVYSAANRIAQSSERIAAAIGQLSAADAASRQKALDSLALAGPQVVNPLLHVLADSARANEHVNIRTTLVQLGRSTETPLIGALQTEDDGLQKQVISVLGRIGSTRAAAFLMRWAVDPAAAADVRQISNAALLRIAGVRPDPYEAEKYLMREIRRFLGGDLPFEIDVDERVTVWQWDNAVHEVKPTALPRRDAGLLLAARLTSDLYALKRQDNAALRLMLLVHLELAKVLSGLDREVPAQEDTAGAAAIAAGPQVVSQVLADALREGRVAAAIAAAEILGKCGDASLLKAPAGEFSPLAQAMVSSDRRVRLAAALTSLKLAPGQLFPGAGRMADTLAWFIETSGSDIVLIGHPRGEDAQSLVGFVNALGFEGEGVYIGRALTERAFANPDYPYLLIADSIDQPPVLELVQWLRRDFRTARTPIGVMARGERFAAVRDAFRDDRLTSVFPLIHSTEVAAIEIDRLRAIAGRNLVGSDERLTQARVALRALAILAKDPVAFAEYNLLRHEAALIRTLNQAALATEAARLLGLYATPRAQAALVDFASQNSRPLEQRQAAAAAFAGAVDLRGLRLTGQQVANQLARYRAAAASSATDQETVAVLASIVKSIEAPAIARGDLTKSD